MKLKPLYFLISVAALGPPLAAQDEPAPRGAEQDDPAPIAIGHPLTENRITVLATGRTGKPRLDRRVGYRLHAQ